jgi:hypothetical protein
MYLTQQSFLPYVDIALFSKESIKGNNIYYLEKALFIEDIPTLQDSLPNARVVMIHPDYYEEWSEVLLEQKDRLNVNVKIFLIHGSDHHIDDIILKPLLISFPHTTFFVQNYVGFHHQCKLLPIGVNQDFITSKKTELCKISYVSYNSFAREEFYIFLNNNPEFTKKYYQVKTDMKTYLQNLSELYFTVCPMGSGFDTIRFWEALMVKTIPIVKRNEFYDTIRHYYASIPFIEIDNWFDLPDLIDSLSVEKYEKLMKGFDDECLKESYWLKLLK